MKRDEHLPTPNDAQRSRIEEGFVILVLIFVLPEDVEGRAMASEVSTQMKMYALALSCLNFMIMCRIAWPHNFMALGTQRQTTDQKQPHALSDI